MSQSHIKGTSCAVSSTSLFPRLTPSMLNIAIAYLAHTCTTIKLTDEAWETRLRVQENVESVKLRPRMSNSAYKFFAQLRACGPTQHVRFTPKILTIMKLTSDTLKCRAFLAHFVEHAHCDFGGTPLPVQPLDT